MAYPVAERFHAPQGEGLYAGTQMAFVRLVGCSVGQKVCQACDTDFDRMDKGKGGGLYEAHDIVAWSNPARHVCVTGGEPLDRDVRQLIDTADRAGKLVHLETSGTRHPDWLDALDQPRPSGKHAIAYPSSATGQVSWRWQPLWLTVCPKPGFLPEMVERVADEVKVIIGGLGDGPGWPTVEQAVDWADAGLLVYVQPRNLRNLPDMDAVREALDVVARWPQLRLSVQMHKFVGTR